MTRILSPWASRASAAGFPVFPVAPVITIMMAPLVAREKGWNSRLGAISLNQMQELIAWHRNFYAVLFCEGYGLGIAGAHVARDADAGVVGQNTLHALAHLFRAASDCNSAAVPAKTHDPATP